MMTSPAAAATTLCQCRPRATARRRPASTSVSSPRSRSAASRCAAPRLSASGALRDRHRRESSARPRGDRGQDRGRRRVRKLGLRLRLRDGFIDCPPPKRRILLRDLGAWHSSVQRLEPFERKTAERQVGRVGNLTQVMPELLTHLSAGYRAANAGYVANGVRRRAPPQQGGADGARQHTPRSPASHGPRQDAVRRRAGWSWRRARTQRRMASGGGWRRSKSRCHARANAVMMTDTLWKRRGDIAPPKPTLMSKRKCGTPAASNQM